MNYPGAKTGSGVYQAIISQMPPHDTYIETHYGSGAIMEKKPRSNRTIAIDISDDVESVYGGGAEFYRVRCEDFLSGFDFKSAGRVLVYADPPYIRGPGEVRGDRPLYGAHEYDRADHVRLISILRDVPAAVILSGYPSTLYDDLLSDWRKIEFQTMTRGGPRTECIWMNFPAGQVQWASFAGRNRTERQMIKRKAARWRGKFEGMKPAERLAVLSALLEANGSADPVQPGSAALPAA